MLIQVDEIHTFYGKSHILYAVDLEIEKGEIVALLGRNGVGKSTTLKSIVGLLPPKRGSIRFKGEEIVARKPHEISRLGIGYVPEERRIFPNLTVLQNLLVGTKSGQRIDHPWTIERIYDYFPQLEKRERMKGTQISGGEQQMLAIGRTLMGNPEVILVDEPSEGLAPIVANMVFDILRGVHKEGISILLVEKNMDSALGLADRAYLMAKGEIVFRGTGEEIYANEEVRKKYLEV